jgi:hypothetical protein
VRIPKYWARAEGQAPPDVDTAEPRVTVWGWSEESRAEAERHAQQRLTETLDRLHQGLGWPTGYAYGVRPPREQILEELRDRTGQVDAMLTRNAYGSVVLNAARVLFVDVDVPWPTLGQRMGRFFGSRAPMPDDGVLARIREFLQNEAGGSYRLYRTAAGFRILATDPPCSPTSREAARLMVSLGADPAFVQLCKVQDSFRARLTPKPWRCGQPNPPSRYPRTAPDEEARFAEWLQKYERACEARATCRFVEAIGRGKAPEDAARVVRLHDERTRASSELPLA